MIQTSISFGEIKVVNSGGLDVVAEFTFTCKSYDDSNESDTTIQNFRIVRLQTANRDSSSEGWVAFNDLTSDKLLEFGRDEYGSWITDTFKNQNLWIQSKLNPPAPATVAKSLPF